MKKYVLLSFLTVLLFLSPIELQAEETNSYVANIKFTFPYDTWASYDYIEYPVVSEYPIYLYQEKHSTVEDSYSVHLATGYYDGETNSFIGYTTGGEGNDTINFSVIGMLYFDDGTSGSYDWFGSCIRFNGVQRADVEMDCRYFPSFDDLVYYLKTGDSKNQINRFMTDAHNFSNDTVDASIPLPEVSNVSHNGFTVENIGSYYVDIIMESRLYGVKHEVIENAIEFSGNYNCVPDFNWVYDSHYYNICDSVDVAYNKGTINIKEDYGVDNVGNLLDSFRAWSAEYPSTNKLPDYSWTKIGVWQKEYISNHVLNIESDVSVEQQLFNSGQAETAYYIRFVTENEVTGQWIHCVYRDGYATVNNGAVNTGTTIVGSTDIDANGNIIIKDQVQGTVDDEGNISYVPSINTGVDSGAALAGFTETVQQFGNAVGSLTGFIGNIFGFLPWWCAALIGLGIAVVIILRVVGR